MTETLIRSYLAAFSTGQPAEVLKNVHPEFVNEHLGVLGKGCAGKDVYAQRLDGFLSQFLQITYTPRVIVAQDQSGFCHYQFAFTQNGKAFEISGMMQFEFRDGLIGRRVDCWDGLDYARQAKMPLSDLADVLGMQQ